MKDFLPVSVIIPCYRCSGTIKRAIDSVFNQTKLPKEIILVEDFSDDKQYTLGFLKNLKQKFHKFNIQILALERNMGPASARNEAWAIASQPYIAFLDADDSWHPKKLELQFSWMIKHPEVFLTAHGSIKLSNDIPQKEINEYINFYPLSITKFLFFNFIPTRSVMIKRNICYRFLPEKRYGEDYLLWLSIALDKHPVYFSDLPLCYSYRGDFGLTDDLPKAHAGLIDVYRQLYNKKKITYLAYIFFTATTILKYMFRFVYRFISRFLNI